MATKPEIIKAIDDKIIAKGNISAVDTNKILKDMLDFSDKPTTPINGFDFGNISNPMHPNDKTSVKMNFTGIDKFSCSLYLCVETKANNPEFKDETNNPDWIFVPVKNEEYKILQSFLPNINEKQMYLTFLVPFLPRQTEKSVVNPNGTSPITDATNVGTKANTRGGISDLPMMIIGLGLLIDNKNQKGVHMILPESGHISTSVTLSYKPNNFNLSMFTNEMEDQINKIFDSILNDNDLIFEEK
jgi:hypothetical protein